MRSERLSVISKAFICLLAAALVLLAPVSAQADTEPAGPAPGFAAGYTSLTVQDASGETKITDLTKDVSTGWNVSDGIGTGWSYNAGSRCLLLSGGEKGITIQKIKADGDLTIATAGVISVEMISVKGKLTIIGAGVLICDAIGCTGGVYCDAAPLFLPDEDGNYALMTKDAVMDESAILPDGKDYVIPAGNALTLTVTVEEKEGETDAFATTQLTVQGNSSLTVCEGGSLNIESKDVTYVDELGETDKNAFSRLQADGDLIFEEGSTINNGGRIVIAGSLTDEALIDCAYQDREGTVFLRTEEIPALNVKSGLISLGCSGDTVRIGTLTLNGFCMIGSAEGRKKAVIDELSAGDAIVAFFSGAGIAEATVKGDAVFGALHLCSYLLNAKSVVSDGLPLDIGYLKTDQGCTLASEPAFDSFGTVPEQFGFVDTAETRAETAPEEGIPFTLTIGRANAFRADGYSVLHCNGPSAIAREYTAGTTVTLEEEELDWFDLWELIDLSGVQEEDLFLETEDYIYTEDDVRDSKVYDAFLVHTVEDGEAKVRLIEKGNGVTVAADSILAIDAVLLHVEEDVVAGSSSVSGVSTETGSGVMTGIVGSSSASGVSAETGNGTLSTSLKGTSGTSQILASSALLEEDEEPEPEIDDPEDPEQDKPKDDDKNKDNGSGKTDDNKNDNKKDNNSSSDNKKDNNSSSDNKKDNNSSSDNKKDNGSSSNTGGSSNSGGTAPNNGGSGGSRNVSPADTDPGKTDDAAAAAKPTVIGGTTGKSNTSEKPKTEEAAPAQESKEEAQSAPQENSVSEENGAPEQAQKGIPAAVPIACGAGILALVIAFLSYRARKAG